MARLIALVCLALLYIGCAAALLPTELVSQSMSRNEVMAMTHKQKEIIVLVSTMEHGRSKTVIVSGPFGKEAMELLINPTVVSENFKIIRHDSAWLAMDLKCNRASCRATAYELRKAENSLQKDLWYYDRSVPAIERAKANEWIGSVLAAHGLRPGWN